MDVTSQQTMVYKLTEQYQNVLNFDTLLKIPLTKIHLLFKHTESNIFVTYHMTSECFHYMQIRNHIIILK